MLEYPIPSFAHNKLKQSQVPLGRAPLRGRGSGWEGEEAALGCNAADLDYTSQ